MSRLKELRLHGFKTFADPTRFVFERGVTAVIGPNGSGKSNMADAVRWVLGEQSNRSLRTRRADDVIFAGSEGRRPQGMAEAILTLDNNDGWLPIDFSEVSIGRRAFRSGETEYLVNGSKARLRDVVDLLAAGRLGANELVVVGQGTVDAALSLRPEERRQLFEEAAGVKNLQVRKNEALGRLARARDNLTRVGDLIGELKPQVRRLALQAQHQQEHDSLGRRARSLVLEIHRRRELIARAALGEARRKKAAAEAALESLRAEETTGREAIASAEAGYWAAESAARVASEQRETAREALIRAEAEADAVSRQHVDLAAGITRAEAELQTIDTTVEAQPAADPTVDLAWEVAREAEIRWRAAADAFEAADHAALSAEEALGAARARAGATIAEAARREEAAARAVARTHQIETDSRAANEAAAAAQEALQAVGAELRLAEAAEAEAVARLRTADLDSNEAQRQADEARASSRDLAERAGGMRAELESLLERAESGSRLGSRLADAGWRALMDAIDPPREAWAAIEALVGGELQQTLLWQDEDLIGKAANARGSARLLVEIDDATPEGRSEALAAVDASRTVAEWIGAGSAQRLFARAVVAPDLATLLRGWRDLPSGWIAVTPEGDLADERGLVIVRGREDEAVGEAARQHARRRELAELVASLEQEQTQAGDAAGHALVAASLARQACDGALAARSEVELRASAARTMQAHAVELLDHATTRATALSAELEAIRGEAVASTGASPSPLREIDLDALATAATAAQQDRSELAARRDELRAAWQTAQSAADAIDAARRGSGFVEALRMARREQLGAALSADRSGLAALDEQRTAAVQGVTAAVAAVEHATAVRDAGNAERDRLRADLLERERTRGGAASRLAELERDAQAAALEAQRHEDELAAIGRERDLAIESLPRAVDAIERAPEDAPIATADADATLEAIQEELGRVRRTVSQIGSVNPFAIDEHRELAGRLETLVAQDIDLSAASASTEQLIGRLDAEIAEQFNAAFVAIGAKFDEFCRLLFAGGSASLQMSDAEGDGEGGIEIAVQPPGKRLQRLPMLSGGERALTGVALLFAMLSVNPVPFCILDEVDAALDEANIGRFADALRVLAQTIDFVVITHNRATIETADTIYGVTMTDAAVSRLLSLRLADVPVEVAVG
ncbi:MAG: chromosome segregation protein SMC [Chloroflexota bacterium]